VVLGGRFTATEIERVYGAFDILIVPSLWFENAPFVIREAFARQRPVITSDIGGMRESVRHSIDGLHFSVGDVDALVACVRRFVAEPDLLPRLRQGIRPPKYYQEHISELLTLYGEMHA
jgi:glycosyltransferase involved in cell wall biosynthesis